MRARIFLRSGLTAAVISFSLTMAGSPSAATAASPGAGSAAPTRSDAAAGPPTGTVHRVDLHAAYQAFLPKERPERRGIHLARGHTPRAAAGQAGACSEPNCPLVYHGGNVQHSPKAYLLLWGPTWSTSGSDTLYLQRFLTGLGVQPNDNWSTSMVQYTDSTGHPSFSSSVLQGTWQDTSSPPSGVTQTQLAAEADAFYTSHGITDRVNTQIVIATPSGTCPQGFYAPSCSGGSGTYCAWHSYTTGNTVPYTNLPYLPDSGGGCGQGSVNSPGTYDGFSIVEGHEYAETVTDPFPNSGWVDTNDSVSGGENADKCAWTNLANVSFSSGSFAMQPLWSNSANGCVMSTSTNPVLTVSKSGTGSGTVTSSPAGISCGSTCSASFASGTAVTLTATPASGSTFTGWGGACSGTGTCSVSMTSDRSVTATFSGSGGTTSQESSLSVAYSGWRGVSDASASGGGYRSNNTTSSTAKLKFNGTAISWVTRRGPDQGIAGVTIDGVSKGTVDLYASSAGSLTKTFSGLASASHTIVVKVNGTKNASSTGTAVAVDAFTVGTTTTQESAKTIAYNAWTGASSTSASGGQYRVAKSAGSTASFSFTGSSVDWITAVGPGWGKAQVYVDGADKGVVDLYSSTAHWQTAKSYTGLTTGAHTITIKVLGTKNAAATSTKVPVDAFVVH